MFGRYLAESDACFLLYVFWYDKLGKFVATVVAHAFTLCLQKVIFGMSSFGMD